LVIQIIYAASLSPDLRGHEQPAPLDDLLSLLLRLNAAALRRP